MVVPPSTTAAAVSSHEVSMPSTRSEITAISGDYRRVAGAEAGAGAGPRRWAPYRGASGEPPGSHWDRSASGGDLEIRRRLAFDLGQTLAVGLRVDVPGPHDQGVVPALGVVVGPDPDRGHAETTVKGDGRVVPDPDLEGEMAGAVGQTGPDQVQHQHPAQTTALPRRVDGDVVHMGFVVNEHLTGEADDGATDPGGPIGPGTTLGQLLDEEPVRPGVGDHRLLDPQHAAQVLGAHGGDDDRDGRPIAHSHCRLVRLIHLVPPVSLPGAAHRRSPRPGRARITPA